MMNRMEHIQKEIAGFEFRKVVVEDSITILNLTSNTLSGNVNLTEEQVIVQRECLRVQIIAAKDVINNMENQIQRLNKELDQIKDDLSLNKGWIFENE